MNRLLQAHLFGAGLTVLSTPELVSRYNGCLEDLGLTPTSLNMFHVDGIGWSPEISQEKENSFYLSHGVANQLGIIVTPDQAGKPIYFPFHSFDRPLMENYFHQFAAQINDVTINNGVWLDIDQELSFYERPHDLLLVNRVIVKSGTGRLLKAHQLQQELSEKIKTGPYHWMDKNLRKNLIEVSSEFGDLRGRQLKIPEMEYTKLDCFFTKAFGGVFIFNNTASKKPLMVMLARNEYDKFKESDSSLKFIEDDDLLEVLSREGLVEMNLKWYKKNIRALKEKLDYFIIEAISSKEPNLNIAEMSEPQIRSKAKNFGLPKEYFELERLIKHLENGEKIKSDDSLSNYLHLILTRPNHALHINYREVVWYLLCQINTFNLLRLYISDKEKFFTNYPAWPENKQAWVVNRITNSYNPRMKK